ncbi:hypothetical protein HU200_061099 [Digitaria exilis]|uniref:Uncharacterized protein n=1 Tax=Digitaria exilis TaxID=1010633 RepID=A0A835A8B8_9POAL|nr:hypothetical protein HU200_061099 [Digitaria exilis]
MELPISPPCFPSPNPLPFRSPPPPIGGGGGEPSTMGRRIEINWLDVLMSAPPPFGGGGGGDRAGQVEIDWLEIFGSSSTFAYRDVCFFSPPSTPRAAAEGPQSPPPAKRARSGYPARAPLGDSDAGRRPQLRSEAPRGGLGRRPHRRLEARRGGDRAQVEERAIRPVTRAAAKVCTEPPALVDRRLAPRGGPPAAKNDKEAAPQEEIFKALRGIPGLAHDNLLRAYSMLIRDDRLFRSLMALPNNTRKDWAAHGDREPPITRLPKPPPRGRGQIFSFQRKLSPFSAQEVISGGDLPHFSPSFPRANPQVGRQNPSAPSLDPHQLPPTPISSPPPIAARSAAAAAGAMQRINIDWREVFGSASSPGRGDDVCFESPSSAPPPPPPARREGVVGRRERARDPETPPDGRGATLRGRQAQPRRLGRCRGPPPGTCARPPACPLLSPCACD